MFTGHLMIPTLELFQPLTFIDGEFYLYVERYSNEAPKFVQFLKYDPCPAFMIVRAPDGEKIRCLREDLFFFKLNNQPFLSTQLSALFRRRNGWLDSEQLISRCDLQ
jgi:hypothetical protein